MKKYLILLFVTLLFSNTFAQVQVGNTTLEKREVVYGLDVPWEIKWGSDNFLWVTERSGIVSRIDVQTGEKHVILDIQNILTKNYTINKKI